MLWTTLKNRHPQHIVTHSIYDEGVLSTTYPHNICTVPTTYRHPQAIHSTTYNLSPTSYMRRCPQCIQNGYPYNISFVGFHILWRSFWRELYRLWSACDMLWRTMAICCGEHPWDFKHMLWVTWLSPTTYARCSPQHIKRSPQHVTHKVYLYPVEYTVYVVENMLCTTQDRMWIYIVEHVVYLADNLTYVVDIYCGIRKYILWTT